MSALRYAWTNVRLRSLLALIVGISFATDPVFTLSPALAESVFHRATADAGVLVSAFGFGAIAGAALLSRSFQTWICVFI